MNIPLTITLEISDNLKALIERRLTAMETAGNPDLVKYARTARWQLKNDRARWQLREVVSDIISEELYGLFDEDEDEDEEVEEDDDDEDKDTEATCDDTWVRRYIHAGDVTKGMYLGTSKRKVAFVMDTLRVLDEIEIRFTDGSGWVGRKTDSILIFVSPTTANDEDKK